MTKLQYMRKLSGMTQAQAAEACGVSLGVWRHYEQGSRPFDGASLKTITTAALVLNCNISDLLDDASTAAVFLRYVQRGEIQRD